MNDLGNSSLGDLVDNLIKLNKPKYIKYQENLINVDFKTLFNT